MTNSKPKQPHPQHSGVSPARSEILRLQKPTGKIIVIPNKSISHNELISGEMLHEPTLAREMLLHAIECGDSVQQALVYTISRMGVSVFAGKAKIPRKDVSNFVKHGSTDTKLIERYLSVFGCELTAKVSRKHKAA